MPVKTYRIFCNCCLAIVMVIHGTTYTVLVPHIVSDRLTVCLHCAVENGWYIETPQAALDLRGIVHPN